MASYACLGLIQGAFTPASDTKDFITGAPGSSFVSTTNETALNTLRDWIKKVISQRVMME